MGSASQGHMGWVKGLEPSTLGTTIRCSNQLSYTHHILFRQRREDTKGFAFLRILLFESLAMCRKKTGTPGGIRTPGLLLRRQLLYPAELLAHINSGTPSALKKRGAGDGNRTHVFSLEG